jgi:DUF4097 and DUF4098 domain-containing protein YvlB
MMFKRLLTFLLGAGLIGLGVFFFIAPEQAYLVQLLKHFWPLCLVLAGLVRLAGYLIDRNPRSPVGSLILTALGGILLAVSLRGENSLALIVGRYWFWFLLAFVAGRVLWQYTHRNAYGKTPRALSPGAIFVMALIATTGLGANYLSNNSQLLSRVNLQIGQIGGVSDYVFGNPIKVDDEAPQSFKLPPNARLTINGFNGDIEIRTGATNQATATFSKFIRATNEERAREAAKNIHLQITHSGNSVQLGVTTSNPDEPFTASLLVEVPGQNAVNLEVSDPTGAVKISELRGDHSLRNCARVKVSGNHGRLSLEGARGLVELSQHEGEVSLTNLHSGAELSEIKGKVALDGQGGNYRLNNLTGALRASVANGRLELRAIQPPPSFPANERFINLDEVRDARLSLNDIKGNGFINATRTRIEAEAVTGDWQVSASSESVKLTRFKGNLRVTAENGSVAVMDLRGAAEIEATRDIAVQNFAGPLNVKTRTGKLTLAHNAELNGDLVAVNEHGQTRVTLPADIAFRLDASTSSGRLRARGFDVIRLTRGQKSLTANYHADGNAPLVSLRSVSGNIELQSSGLALASNDEQ